MRVFIVRPFGSREGIDFDRVDRELIAPALAAIEATGGTTGEILESGNIRTDMFQLLVTADLVIADVSIDNANVYYELGIRHALRSRRTVLIRAKARPSIPFDLRTDRYMEYEPENPGGAVGLLQDVLRQTRANNTSDSPVFLLLPELAEPDHHHLLPVPLEFREEVDRAAARRQVGRLGLLGWESIGFAWEREAARLVGRRLFDDARWESSRAVWERVRGLDANDVEANLTLGTIYQRLGLLPESDQSLERVLAAKDTDREDRAEALALRGRNDKTRLIKSLEADTACARQKHALGSRFLLDAYTYYRSAYLHDVNSYFSGLNALALASVMVELMDRHPDVWNNRWKDDEQARSEESVLRREREMLKHAVALSIESARARAAQGKRNAWIEISTADHQFLTGAAVSRVAQSYRNAIEGVDVFFQTSACGQLRLYRDLEIFQDRTEACLKVFGDLSVPAPVPPLRAIVFTGHLVDSEEPDAKNARPRFPSTCQDLARDEIKRAIEKLCLGDAGRCIGYAGGANGGDILFHEVCAELGIVTHLRLTLPDNLFIAESVAPGGSDWIDRFRKIKDRLETTTEILGDSKKLPGWLQSKVDYNVWQRTNVWLLEEALASGARELYLVALWDGEKGRGVGGTSGLIQLARDKGVHPIVLDTNKVFGIEDSPE